MKIKFIYKELTDDVKYIIETFNKNGIYESDVAELLIAIGGDGTLFYAIAKNKNVDNFMLINTGTLGFYSEYTKDNILLLIDKIKNNKLIYNKYELLNFIIESKDKKYNLYSLNDFMIRSTNYKSAYMELYINDKKLEQIVGDGILFSTSYGSTAYNLSLNGPIFLDDNLIAITPLNPIRNNQYNCIRNTIIIDKKSKIEIKPFKKTKDIIIISDGNLYKIENVNRIYLNNKTKKINILSAEKVEFLDKIVNKIM